MPGDSDFAAEYYGEEVLSASWVNMFYRCPRQYGYVKYAGLRSPPGWAMVGGSAMDATLNAHLAEKIRGLNGLRGSALTDFYREKLKNLVLELQPQGERDEDLEIDGVRLLPMYERQVSPKIEPIAVQHELEKELPLEGSKGRKFQMHMDLLRRGQGNQVIVSDHKFTGRSPAPDKAQKSLQLRAYDWGIDDPIHQVELINLVRLKREPKIVVQSHFVSTDERAEFLRMAKWAAHLTGLKVFPQVDPTNWGCSPVWCGFYSICRGREGGPLPIPGEVTL